MGSNTILRSGRVIPVSLEITCLGTGGILRFDFIVAFAISILAENVGPARGGWTNGAYQLPAPSRFNRTGMHHIRAFRKSDAGNRVTAGVRCLANTGSVECLVVQAFSVRSSGMGLATADLWTNSTDAGN